MTWCVILLPIAITFSITWFINFVNRIFSPICAKLDIDIFGLGFITSIMFIFGGGIYVILVGCICSDPRSMVVLVGYISDVIWF
ncbi:hypothetical protein Hanom_Chr07g00648321 [Helianthus anomalus]